jgi:hypothetical protein
MGGKNRLQAMELRLRTVLRSLWSAASTLAQRAAHAGVWHQSRAAQFPPFDDLGFLVAVNGQLPKPTCRNHPCTVIHDLRHGSLPPLPDRRTNCIVRAALRIRVEADRRFPSGRGRFRKTMWRLRQLPGLFGGDCLPEPALGLLAAFQSFGKGILGTPVRQTLGR